MPEWDWLEQRGGFIGCTICSAAGASGASANFTQPVSCVRAYNLERHAKMATHKRAEQQRGSKSGDALGDDDDAVSCMNTGVTSPAEFRNVWDDTKGGQCMTTTDLGIDSRKKSRALLWCLAEAIRRGTRDALRQSSAMTLMKDERKGYVLIRFRS